ncbi:unnamed protein product, partial [Musa banksii]
TARAPLKHLWILSLSLSLSLSVITQRIGNQLVCHNRAQPPERGQLMEVAACDGPPGAEGTKDQRRASLSMGQRGQGMKRTTDLGLMDGGRQVAQQSLYLILSFSDHDLFFLERKPPPCWSQGPLDDDDTTTEWKATGRFDVIKSQNGPLACSARFAN